jgi:oxygen-dependent protoporphyrinogen oxidase
MHASENDFDGLIVGGGISGLAVAHWLRLHEDPGSWQLWEASERVGGTIGTERTEGYSVDWGPNGFLDREPLTLKLVEELGLTPRLERADEKSEKRFILKGGRLHPVPFSPPAMVKTGLLRPHEKLRLFAEPFVRARRDDEDESVFDFAARRIGRAAAARFVDPMVSGVFGGLARELSLPSCFPIMREMELKYGGLVKALIARRRERREQEGGARMKSGGPAGPGGWLTSFQTGLDVLVAALHERLRQIIRTGRPVVGISYSDGLWEAHDGRGHRARARSLVIACPTGTAASITEDFDKDLSAAFSAIPYAAIAVVASGHRREDIAHPLDGFGFLIPRGAGLRTLGSIWTSSIFAGRAPEGHVQFRTMLGGAGDPSAIRLSDGDLWATVQREIGPLLGIRGTPEFLRIYRWQEGIPQFTLGHRERRRRLEEAAARYPRLYLAGNAYYGVGLNDCVKMAHSVARRIKGAGA